MSTGPDANARAKKSRPAATDAVDERTIITLTESVQKLGGIERARQALEALSELKKTA